MSPLGSISVNLPADIVLTPSDGSGPVYLMLAPAENNKKSWQMSEIPAPAGVRVSSVGAGLQDLPPEMAQSVFRTDNMRGMRAFIIDNIGTDYMSGSVQTSAQGKIIQAPYVEEIIIPGEDEGLTAIAVYQGNLYVANAHKVFRSDDGLVFVETLDVGVAVIKQLLTYGAADGDPGIICVTHTAEDAPSDYHYSLTGVPTSWTTVSLASGFSFMCVQNGQLWGLTNPNILVTTTDPYDPTPIWASSTTVGDTQNNFQAALDVSNFLLVFKENGVWAIPASGIPTKVITQFDHLPGSDNFEAVSPGWSGNIYMAVDQDVWEYDPSSGGMRPLGLSKLPDSQINGTSTVRQGVTYDEEGIFVIHQTNIGDEQGTSIIRTDFSPDGSMGHERWLLETVSGYRPDGPILFMRNFTTLGTGRHLFFALRDPSGVNTDLKIGRMTVPRAKDPTRDPSSEFSVVDGIYRSGWMHHNFPAQFKDYTEVLLDLKGLSTSPPASSVSAYYYLDGDQSVRYTLAEEIDTDRLQLIEFDTGVTARSFMLELILHNDNLTNTPQVLSWNVKASVKFDFREIFTLAVRVGDRITMRNNRRSPLTAAQLRQRIRQLRAAKNVRIRYQDYRGYDFDNVRILTGITEIDLIDDENRTDETMMTLRIMRVSEPFLRPFIIERSAIRGLDVIGDLHDSI